jgi:glycosyltransferase
MIVKNKIPKISIITVVLNSNKTILETINSVKRQKYQKNKIEHILIDGGSTDGTLEIIKKNKKNLKYWHSKKDKGIYDAINIGIKKSTGEIIGILNADDFFYENTFSIVHKYFDKYNIDYLFGSVIKNRIYHNFFPKKIYYTFNICPAHSVSFFIKKDAQKKMGEYNIKYKYSADRDLFYRIIKNNLKGMATKKSEIFGKFRLNGISSKISYYETLKEELKVRLNNQNFILALLVISLSIINKIYNHLINKN